MKKIIALVLSMLLCVSMMVPAVALDLGGLLGGGSSEDGGEGGGIDIGTILNSDIVQSLLANEGVMDVTAIVLQIVGMMNQETLEEMGKEQVENMLQTMIDELGWQLSAITGNKDLIITYDPLKVMGNLFNFDEEQLTQKDDEEEDEESDHPDELVIGMGDVDGDGRVTASDARLILRAAAQLVTLTMEQEALADVDNDGEVTALDARIVLRVAAELETLDA